MDGVLYFDELVIDDFRDKRGDEEKFGEKLRVGVDWRLLARISFTIFDVSSSVEILFRLDDDVWYGFKKGALISYFSPFDVIIVVVGTWFLYLTDILALSTR